MTNHVEKAHTCTFKISDEVINSNDKFKRTAKIKIKPPIGKSVKPTGLVSQRQQGRAVK